MEQIDCVQGDDAWHNHRAAHFNASDAPAMLGISQYKSRTQLLREMSTGITPDVDEATQRRFDAGHRFEALARPLAEQIIGKKLYPVIGSEGKLSASFDGLTADDSTAFEHKSLNNGLREALSAGEIPEQYCAQMEQQLMLSGADKCLFMASIWNDADELIEEMHQWYEGDPDMRDRLLQGWTQFAIDLENYVHVEHIEKPKAEVCIELPALFVHARGEITEHNMEAFGVALTAKLAEVRAIALLTDQDFSNAKEAAKKFRLTAKEITLSEAAMLAQTETIGEASRKMKAWVKDLNATALQLEKDVEREDLAKKEVMVLEGRQAYTDHIAALEAEIKPIRITLPQPNFTEAIKGKRNYASMHDAIQTMLAGAKMEADAQAKDVRAKLKWCKETSAGFGFLFSDMAAIISKPMDDFQLVVTSRIKDHKEAEAAKVEAQRVAIQAAATAKAEREAAEKLAEAEAKLRAAQAEEDALVDSIWKQARRVEGDSVQYVNKAIVQFETVAKAWESDPRPRVASAIADARQQLSEKLRAADERAKAEADAAAKLESERSAMQAEHDKAPSGEPAVIQAAIRKCDGNHGGPRCDDPNCWNNSPATTNTTQSEAGTHAGARPVLVQTEPAALSPEKAYATIVDHQDEISAFMRSRDFGKDANKIRAIICEFVKFQATSNLKEAA